MENTPGGKKAELDKDGISRDLGKAELDKDGVSLSDELKDDEPPAEEALQEDVEQTPAPWWKRRFIILCAAAGTTVVLLVAGTALFFLREEPAKEKAHAVHVKPSPPPGLDSPEGDIVLDPFMVLYESRGPEESGVLLATLSLQVGPETAYTLGSRMYDIRSLVYDRLSANAEIYTKDELTTMIREDLKDFNVHGAEFVRFEKR